MEGEGHSLAEEIPLKITPDWKDESGHGLEDIGWALKYEGSICCKEKIERGKS